jgi:hypothetical protein
MLVSEVVIGQILDGKPGGVDTIVAGAPRVQIRRLQQVAVVCRVFVGTEVVQLTEDPLALLARGVQR